MSKYILLRIEIKWDAVVHNLVTCIGRIEEHVGAGLAGEGDVLHWIEDGSVVVGWPDHMEVPLRIGIFHLSNVDRIAIERGQRQFAAASILKAPPPPLRQFSRCCEDNNEVRLGDHSQPRSPAMTAFRPPKFGSFSTNDRGGPAAPDRRRRTSNRSGCPVPHGSHSSELDGKAQRPPRSTCHADRGVAPGSSRRPD